MNVTRIPWKSIHVAQHKSKSLSPTAVLLCAFATTCVGTSFYQQLIKPEDQQVSVQGTIRLVHDFGPPSYGEDPKHDAHVTYSALEVPVPINTPCTLSSPQNAKYECGSAKRMKLFFDGLELKKLDELPAAKWKGRQVVVVGKLHRADTAGEMTPIYSTSRQSLLQMEPRRTNSSSVLSPHHTNEPQRNSERFVGNTDISLRNFRIAGHSSRTDL